MVCTTRLEFGLGFAPFKSIAQGPELSSKQKNWRHSTTSHFWPVCLPAGLPNQLASKQCWARTLITGTNGCLEIGLLHS